MLTNFSLSLMECNQQKCGIVVSWKRVQGAHGKLQGKHSVIKLASG